MFIYIQYTCEAALVGQQRVHHQLAHPRDGHSRVLLVIIITIIIIIIIITIMQLITNDY